MAIVQQTYSPHQFRAGIAKQSAFGTANTTQAEFIALWLTNHPEPSSTPLIDETKRADGSVIASTTDRYVAQAGGEHTIAVEGVLTMAQAAYLLFGSMQYLTSEGASTPYAKVFTLGTGVVPASSVACCFTVLIYDPSGNNIALQDCVFKTLTLSQSPGSQGGRITFSGTLYSGAIIDTTSVTATPGDWVSPGTTFYGLSNLDTPTIDIGGGALDVVVYGWSLTIDNGAKAYPAFDSNGHALGMAIGASTAGIAITGELTVKYDGNTKDAYEDFLANATLTISLPFYATTSTDLTFTINARHKAQPTRDAGADAGVQITYNFEGVYSGSTAALVATVEDGVDRSW